MGHPFPGLFSLVTNLLEVIQRALCSIDCINVCRYGLLLFLQVCGNSRF